MPDKGELAPNSKCMTETQARKNHVKWKSWRDPSAQKGEWVLTDDGYVLCILGRYDCVNSRGYASTIYRTSLVTYSNWNQAKQSYSLLVADNVITRGSIGSIGNPKREWGSATEKEKRWFDMVLSGFHPEHAYKTIFPKSNRPVHIRQRVNSLLKSRRIMEYMSEKTKDVLEKMGLDKDWVAKQLKEMGEDKETAASVRLSAIQDIGKMLDMYPKKETTIKEQSWVGMAQLTGDEVARLEGHKTETTEAEVIEDEQKVEE